MTSETQKSVTDWAEETFGPVRDHTTLVKRAQVEMDELLEATAAADTNEMGKEAADVLILLMRLAEINNIDLNAAVNSKMQENRLRKWQPAGDGTGKHIKAS